MNLWFNYIVIPLAVAPTADRAVSRDLFVETRLSVAGTSKRAGDWTYQQLISTNSGARGLAEWMFCS